MKKMLAVLFALAALPLPVMANSDGRVIAIDATEMAFHPEKLNIAPGEHVTFIVTNSGALQHEFVIGTLEEQAKHREQMKAGTNHSHGHEHGHDHAGGHDQGMAAITVEPGETKRLAWTAPDHAHGQIEYACNIPGHYETGMHGAVSLEM